MLDWIRGVFGARPGDGVRVTQGPYAGRSGTLMNVTADGRFTVHIDECCQPVLPASSFRRVRRRSRVADAVRSSKEADLESEAVRAGIDGRDLGDGF